MKAATCCAPISPAATLPTVALLHPAHAGRGSLQESQGDLAIRPIYHQNEARIEAHIFIAFLAYCLHVT